MGRPILKIDPMLEFQTTTLNAGTLLFHGTSAEDFDEETDVLDGPAWVSTSESVAKYFARRNKSGFARVVTYRLGVDVSLPEIQSSREMQHFSQEYDLSLDSVEDMRDSILSAGLPGWVIPNNYPDGDDIVLTDTSPLLFVNSTPV